MTSPGNATAPRTDPGSGNVAGGGLRRLLARGAPAAAGAPEPPGRCELCAEPLPSGHRHLVDLDARLLRCACRACTVLFDRPAAGGGRYRLVPDRRWHLPDFALDGPTWERLGIPVGVAFFFHDSAAGRTVAFYPSPAGPVESQLDPAAWHRIAVANPVLDQLTPDLEALLVNRVPGAHDHWLVPIDECYALVGLIRTKWTGLSGGSEVWEELARYFTALRTRARPVPGHKRSIRE